jgi:dipeptidyl aminopeptidase/acylaminoacyl peptidase
MIRRAVAALSLILALLPVMATAGTRYDPRLRFQTLSTARFDIHFHQGEEWLARHLEAFVEEAAKEVDAAVGAAVGRVHIILVDQHDVSNGWATPVPYNTIEISVAAPTAESVIGNSPDWLRIVFVHEYTHIAHLSRAGGWVNGLRRGFGRLPLLFPNLYQPVWAIEGIATWNESHQTQHGRVAAGDFRLWLNSAVTAGKFEPMDRVNGGNVDWPGGNGPYLYGAYFHEFLAQRGSSGSIRELAAETGRRLPYFGSRAYKKVFGRSLGELWREFENSVGVQSAPPSRAVRLTTQGFRVATPRLRADGRLFYSSLTPHGFPALMELAPEAQPRFVSRRYPGGTIAFAGNRLLVDELDLVRSVGLQSDLYLVDAQSGARRRVTREARAADPDVGGNGTSVVCTIQMADRRAIATFELPGPGRYATPQVLVSAEGVNFAVPRWSPDGRLIVAERQRRGDLAEIVLIDVSTRKVRALAKAPGARTGAPVWTPDGAAVLFSAAPNDLPFRIYRVDIATGALSRLDGTGVSAQSPTVSADGGKLVFIGYTPQGYDLFALGLNDAEWIPVDSAPTAPIQLPAEFAATTKSLYVPVVPPGFLARPYSPLRTLLPTFWTPTLESDGDEVVVGAATGSADALGRHAYGIEAGWSSRARPDWQVAYAYDRWRPTLFGSYSDDTDPWRDGTVRTREANAGMLLPFQQVRRSQSILAAAHVADDQFDCGECQSPIAAAVTRRSIRGGYAFSTAQQYGYSISTEEGTRASVTGEASRANLDGDPPEGPVRGNGVALTADLRHFVPLGPRHGVLALRLAAAGYFGSDEAQQVFSVSGNGPQSGGFGFGVDAIGLLRGFSEDALIGTRAAVVNVDYRVPLMRIARGLGTLPGFVRNLHGAMFADVGEAWTTTGRWRDVSASFGAEVSADTVIGFVLPLTLTGGVALRRDGPARDRDLVVFGRVGRAF